MREKTTNEPNRKVSNWILMMTERKCKWSLSSSGVIDMCDFRHADLFVGLSHWSFVNNEVCSTYEWIVYVMNDYDGDDDLYLFVCLFVFVICFSFFLATFLTITISLASCRCCCWHINQIRFFVVRSMFRRQLRILELISLRMVCILLIWYDFPLEISAEGWFILIGSTAEKSIDWIGDLHRKWLCDGGTLYFLVWRTWFYHWISMIHEDKYR